MKTGFYQAGKLLVRFVFGCVARIRVIGREHGNCAGGFLLTSNHMQSFRSVSYRLCRCGARSIG